MGTDSNEGLRDWRRPGGSRRRERQPIWTEWRGVWSDLFFPMNQETAERWQTTYLEQKVPDLTERQLIEFIPLMRTDWTKQKNPKPDDLIAFIQREWRRELLEGTKRSCPHCMSGWALTREFLDGMGGRHLWWCDPPPGENMQGVWIANEVQVQCKCVAGQSLIQIVKQKDPDIDEEALLRRAEKVCRWHLTLAPAQKWHYMPGYRHELIEKREQQHRNRRRKSDGTSRTEQG